jgi:polyhydroxyalkanoate synthase
MDLIPKPDQVASAAGNVAHLVLYGGLADLRPMPRTLVDDGPLREVHHYRPLKTTRETGDPVLLVSPLAAPASCYDLRRDCSLVEHLVEQARPTYVVEYGEISFEDRTLGMERWVEEVVPEAVKAVSEHAGGRPVHVVGWSLGGLFAVLTAADRPDLPIASLSVLAAPVDVRQVPLVAPARPILEVADRGIVTQLLRALAATPTPLVRRAVELGAGTELVTKPLALLQHLDDAEWLAQVEAVGRFSADVAAFPGRTFGQLYHRMLPDDALLDGTIDLSGHKIDLSAITVPVLVLAGNTDGIAPIDAVRPLVGLLPHAREARLEIVPGGHLGMLTGRAARETTWPTIDEWIAQHSSDARPAAAPSPAEAPVARRTRARRGAATKAPAQKTAAAKKAPAQKTAAAKKAPAQKTAAAKKAPAQKTAPARKASTEAPVSKKATVKKTAAKRTPASKRAASKKATATGTAADQPTIGSNPERRFTSAPSRHLTRRS